ncbi:MAG: aminotransferase class I/II-fold pyridoxal phosphate-dependent enzyme [Imperialibacter sp.]|uniref:aminotransferase class I/II-fold pyridoxal phosphate-dependent enzyme n=1 Tax=Imperialibacter sp. TaxID=2038411 RepID=UPI0032EBBBD4
MMRSEEFPGRTLHVNGKEMLYFSGTSYLGLSVDKEYQELIKEGVDKYGVHFSGSRNSNVQYSLFEEAERHIADWLSTGDAVVTSSGFASGQLLIKVLQDMEWSMEYAPGCHPALWRNSDDATNGDFISWSTMIRVQLEGMLPRRMVLLCNSTDPLFCNPVNFDWLTDISTLHEVLLVVDDSHGIGLTGKNGEGVVSQLRKLPSHVQWVVTSSLGKAPGLAAGFIAGSHNLIKKIRQSPWFVGAAPSAPAFLHALLKGGEIRARQLQKLRKFQLPFGSHSLVKQHFNFQPVLPVFFSKSQPLYTYLLSRNIIISHFPYPKPTSSPISRIILHAALDPADIGNLLEEIKTFYEDFQ